MPPNESTAIENRSQEGYAGRSWKNALLARHLVDSRPNPRPEAKRGDRALSDSEIGQADDSAELPKVVSFQDLARCGNEVWIRNGGQLYRLQQTRQGKLILTK